MATGLLRVHADTQEVAVNGGLHVKRTADVGTVLIQRTACRTGCRVTGGDTNIFMADQAGTTDPGDRITIASLATGSRWDTVGENTAIGTPTFCHAAFVVLAAFVGHRITGSTVSNTGSSDPVRAIFDDALPFISAAIQLLGYTACHADSIRCAGLELDAGVRRQSITSDRIAGVASGTG